MSEPTRRRRPRRRFVGALIITLSFAALVGVLGIPHPRVVPGFPYPYAATKVREAAQTVVRIQAYDERGYPESVGSGIVLADDVIATCLHVIEGAAYVTASTFGGHDYPITAVIDSLEDKDLALLRTDASLKTKATLHRWPLPDYERVFALGYSSYAMGDAPDLAWGTMDDVEDGWITHITSTLEGFSGGGVFGETGELLGMSVALRSGNGFVSYALTAKHLKDLFERPGRTEDARTFPPSSEWPYLSDFLFRQTIYSRPELTLVIRALDQDFERMEPHVAYERIAKDPLDVEAHRSLLVHAVVHDDWETASTEFAILDSLMADDPLVAILGALVHASNEDYESAIQHIQSYSYGHTPLAPHRLLTEGLLYLIVEEPTKALMAYQQLNVLRSDLAEELFVRIYDRAEETYAEAEMRREKNDGFDPVEPSREGADPGDAGDSSESGPVAEREER